MPLLHELFGKLNALDIETAFEDEVLFAVSKGEPIDPAERPEAEKVPELLAEVRDECVFARSVASSDGEGTLNLMTDASCLLSDLRLPQLQTLLHPSPHR